MAHAHALARPGTVLTVVVLTFVQAAVDVIAGIGLIVASQDANLLASLEGGEAAVLTAGIVTLLFGVAIAGLAVWLNGGANGARMTITVVMAIQIVGGFFTLFQFGTGQLAEAVMTLAVAIGVLALLWSERANEYFTS